MSVIASRCHIPKVIDIRRNDSRLLVSVLRGRFSLKAEHVGPTTDN